MAVTLARVGLTALMLLAGCSLDSDPTSPDVDSIALMPLPDDHLIECERIPELQPACPRSLPMVDPIRENRARSFRSGKGSFVFFSEWSGPYPGITSKNAPPRFVHVNVHGGDLNNAFSFQSPLKASALPEPIPRKRSKAHLLKTVSWFGKTGSLVLAPSFPSGGIDGDHLLFRWEEGPEEYAISIHAWAPLSETTQALRAVVGSLSIDDS